MAHAPSAKRHIRADEKKRVRNKARKSAITTFEKKFNAALTEGNTEEATKALQVCFSAYDRAVKKGVVKRATADRRKSRLNLALNKASK